MRESLATLRDVDAIAHVIRVFDDPSVPHSEGTIDPLRDVTNLDLELILSDHEQITKRLERLEKDLKKKKDPQFELEKTVLEKCKSHLEAERPLREFELTPEERKPIGGFLFLSQRPMLYVLNLGDDEAAEMDKAVEKHKLSALQGRPNTAVVAVCGRLEAELAEMDEKEAAELLASYGLKEPGPQSHDSRHLRPHGPVPFLHRGGARSSRLDHSKGFHGRESRRRNSQRHRKGLYSR